MKPGTRNEKRPYTCTTSFIMSHYIEHVLFFIRIILTQPSITCVHYLNYSFIIVPNTFNYGHYRHNVINVIEAWCARAFLTCSELCFNNKMTGINVLLVLALNRKFPGKCPHVMRRSFFIKIQFYLINT